MRIVYVRPIGFLLCAFFSAACYSVESQDVEKDTAADTDTDTAKDTDTDTGSESELEISKEEVAKGMCAKMVECDSSLLSMLGGEGQCEPMLMELVFSEGNCSDAVYDPVDAANCLGLMNGMTCDEYELILTSTITPEVCNTMCEFDSL